MKLSLWCGLNGGGEDGRTPLRSRARLRGRPSCKQTEKGRRVQELWWNAVWLFCEGTFSIPTFPPSCTFNYSSLPSFINVLLVFFLLLIPSYLPPFHLSLIYTYTYYFLPSLPPSFICLYCTFLPSLTDKCIVSFHPPSLPIFIDTYYLFFSSVLHYFLASFIFSSAHPFFLSPSLHLFIPSLIQIQHYFLAGAEICFACRDHQFNTEPVDNHWPDIKDK